MKKDKIIKYWVSNTLIDSFGSQRFEYLTPLLEPFLIELIPLWGYELKTQQKEFEVDIQLCINNDKRRPKLLTQLANANKFREDIIWHGISKFAEKWSNESHHFSQKVSNIWFEFDQGKVQSDIFTPNMFFAPLKGLSPEDICQLTKEIFSTIQQKEIEYANELSLEKCLALLTNGAWISQIGIMFSRKSKTLRLFIQDLSLEDTISFLDNMNWKGNKSLLAKTLKSFYELVEFIDLDIDVFDSISDKIGLELYFKNSHQLMSNIKEALNRLFDLNCIYPDNYKKLTNYFNILENQNNDIKEFLHHIKLGISASEQIEAKVYIGLRQNRKLRLLSNIFSDSSGVVEIH